MGFTDPFADVAFTDPSFKELDTGSQGPSGQVVIVACTAKVKGIPVRINERFHFNTDFSINHVTVDCEDMDVIEKYRAQAKIDKEPYSVYPVNKTLTYILCTFLFALVVFGLCSARAKPMQGSEPLLQQ